MYLPKVQKPLRGCLICWLVVCLWWLGLEEADSVYPSLLGLSVACLGLLRYALLRWGGQALSSVKLTVITTLGGAVLGLSGSIVVLLLMVFKNAQHGHLFLDFPPEMLIAILMRAPFWAVAGALMGFGLALGWQVWHERRR